MKDSYNREIQLQCITCGETYFEMNEDKEEAKRAIVEANVIKYDNGKRVIKVYNKGGSIAKNVNVIIPNHEGYKIIIDPSPIYIRPQHSIEIIMINNMKVPDKTEFEFIWTDKANENNRDRQSIQL